MFRKALFYAEFALVVFATISFLFAWMAFTGPQMHVAETFVGLAIGLLFLGLGFLWARRRLRHRDATAEALRRAAELEQARAEEEKRLKEAWEKKVRAEELKAQWEAERVARLERAVERARQKIESSPDMSGPSNDGRHRQFDVRSFIDELLSELTEQEQLELSEWLKKLLKIRELEKTSEKLRSLGITLKSSRALAPIAKIILNKLKKHGWDDLGGVAKWTVGAGGGALLLFGGAGAGIAAFGGAIGVPLFVVFGAGGALAGTIIQEIDRRSKK